jgi:mannose-1-phosphate guanylyltransferase
VAVVPGAFTWNDVGDFATLRELLPTADDGVAVLGDPALVTTIDASGFVAPRGGRHVAVLGLTDVVVVDTGDAVLVTTVERAQDVKAVVDALTVGGRPDLT